MKRILIACALLLSLLAAHWLRQGAIDTPSVAEPLFQRALFDAEFVGPTGKRIGAALIRQKPVVPLVVALFLHGRPSHVAVDIVPIGVDAVDRHVPAGALADVSEKGREVGFPFSGDSNASAAIDMKVGVRLVVAAGLHGGPRDIFRRPALAVRLSDRVPAFSVEASTRSRDAFGEATGGDRFLDPAVTEANPMSFALDRA